MNQLDHVVLAVADLEEAKAAFADETGVMPVDGGPHLGLGTRNALVSFIDSYLELIAPDPEQVLEGTMGARLAELTAPHLLHWAVRTDDLDAVSQHVRDSGLDPTPARHTSRRTPDGTALTWALLGVRGHRLGGILPFYIDWLDSPHPSLSAPRVGAARFTVTLPPGSSAERLLTPLPRGVDARRGEPALHLQFDSPRGTIDIVEAAPEGFGFR